MATHVPRQSKGFEGCVYVASVRSGGLDDVAAKLPFDRSRSSRRIWNPYFSSLFRSASRHSWIEPFFSSAVHSGETSVIRSASYPTVRISAFGHGWSAGSRNGRHRIDSLQEMRSSVWSGERKRGGAQVLRLAFARRYRAGPIATETTANWAARIVTGVRFTPDGRS